MISKVHVQNYRCLKSVNVELAPLTVLIGENDTGKSSFLRALLNLLPDPQGVDLTQRENWYRGTERPTLSAWNADQSKTQRFPSNAEKGNWSIPSQGIQLVHLPAAGPDMTAQVVEGVPRLGSDGSGAPALLDYFLHEDRPRYDAYEAAVRSRVPGVRAVNLPLVGRTGRAIELVLDSGFKIRANDTSAGVKCLLYFLALAHHPLPPEVLLLEEPENGLHPRRLSEVVHLLREFTRGTLAYGSKQPGQVVLSTHSPYLLDEVDPETDQVLVFTREDDGSRTAKAIDKEGLKVFLDEFKLGEVWFNEQEAGLTKP